MEPAQTGLNSMYLAISKIMQSANIQVCLARKITWTEPLYEVSTTSVKAMHIVWYEYDEDLTDIVYKGEHGPFDIIV